MLLPFPLPPRPHLQVNHCILGAGRPLSLALAPAFPLTPPPTPCIKGTDPLLSLWFPRAWHTVGPNGYCRNTKLIIFRADHHLDPVFHSVPTSTQSSTGGLWCVHLQSLVTVLARKDPRAEPRAPLWRVSPSGNQSYKELVPTPKNLEVTCPSLDPISSYKHPAQGQHLVGASLMSKC